MKFILASLSRFVYRHKKLVLALGGVFLIIAVVAALGIYDTLKDGGFFSPLAESSLANKALKEQLGKDEQVLLVLFTSLDNLVVTDPVYRAEVERTLGWIKNQPGVGNITTFYNSPNPERLISFDKRSTYVMIGLAGSDDNQFKTLKNLRPLLVSDRLKINLGGNVAIVQEASDQAAADLQKAEMLSIPVVAVLLIFVFGSLTAASLPLAIGVFSVLGSYLILRILGSLVDVSVFAVNVTNLIALGLGIDYSLFMVTRFREELARSNGAVQPALDRTMQTAGRTVFFSGLTVAISLLSLLILPQNFFKGIGLGGTASVIVAVLASLTILPALMGLLGHRINSLSLQNLIFRRRPAQAASSGSSFWYKACLFVMRHPVLVLAFTIIPLLLGATPILRANLEFGTPNGIPLSFQSRMVADKLQTDFPPNEATSIILVVKSNNKLLDPSDPLSGCVMVPFNVCTGTTLDAASLDALFDYSRQIAALPGVKRVDSLVTIDPRLDKAAYQNFYSPTSLAQNPPAAAAAKAFSKGRYSLVSVVYNGEPTSPANKDLVRSIRGLVPPGGLSAQVTGLTAVQVDLLQSLAENVPLAIGVIVVVIFILLFLMLGSLVVPLKAVVLNFINLSFGFGALVWVFQDGNLSNLLGFVSNGAVDPFMIVLIFSIAFGLSMDYEVFLLSRIKEQYDRTKDNDLAVASGIEKTSKIITNAAILLVIVIGSFTIGITFNMKQIGFGLALVVLVDATIIRMLVVPATMKLLGKHNWWAPRPLAAVFNKLGFQEVEEKAGVEPVRA